MNADLNGMITGTSSRIKCGQGGLELIMINTNWLRKATYIATFVAAVSSAGLFADTSDTKIVRADLHVVVKQGDSLTGIVKRELGSLESWSDVVQVNKMSSPDTLKPGDVIVIPWELLQSRNYARVVFVKGEVALQRSGATEIVKMKKGDKIFVGDTIATGDSGFVSLSFKSDSTVNIQTDSQAQLKALDCFDIEKACEIKLKTETSDMKIDVKSVGFSKPTNFTIETPYASAAVRGTEFDFSTRDGNILGVTAGEVAISVNDTANSVPKGKGTLAGEGRSIGVLYNLLNKPQFNEFPRVSAQDFISWQPIDKAALYKVVIAASESLGDIISVNTGDDLRVPALPVAGTYYVSARAIANNGLKGFESVKRIDQVKVDSSVSAAELDIELIDSSLTVKPQGRFTTEVHIGSRLDPVDGLDTLVEYKSYDIAAGETLELTVDPAKPIYLISRAVISRGSVSEYGGLYELRRVGK